MRRNFLEPKTRGKNRAKFDRIKIGTLKSAQSLKNKRKFKRKTSQKSPNKPIDLAKIRLSGVFKVDRNP